MKQLMAGLCLCALGCTRPVVNAAASIPADAGQRAAVVALPPVDAGSPHHDTIVRFVAIGDTGKGNADQHTAGDSIGDLCASKGCDFVVLLGDNFYPTGVSSTNDPQWQTTFIEPYSKVNVPFYAVLGNHDYGGNGSGNEIDKGQHEVDYSAVNPKWRMPAPHYKFNVGPVDFFVADTNRSMYALDDRARADFEQWLPASTAPWKIVFGHHPLKSNGRHGNAGTYDGVPSVVPIASGGGVKSFLEDFVCGRADVYLCGHEHVLEWLAPTCTRPGSTINTELMISGGGSGVTGFVKEPPNEDHWRAAVVGYVYVVIENKTFTGTYYDLHGKELFTRSFTKP